MVADLSIDQWFDSREAMLQAFLAETGMPAAGLARVGEDCAFRRYFRLRHDRRSFILMEAVPDDDERATPGHRIGDFIRIGRWLRDQGLHAPEIFAADEANGYLLIEDFGTLSFKAALQLGKTAQEVYGLATDVLERLAAADPAALTLPRYYDSHVHTGRRRIIDWYMPLVLKRRNPDRIAEEYLSLWDEIERSLPPCPQGFLHVDYHVENLMWREGEKGLSRCGILDFQGAMTGPVPYDLANLLEDARIDVPASLRTEMLGRYTQNMAPGDAEAFRLWYRVLATQFHCRLIGQFIRLALRDGKERYLAYLPRVAAYLETGLQHPVLAPMHTWLKEQGVLPEHDMTIEFSGARPLIRDDAF